ncbi:unnamed protein product [Penicillium viridicatum]
MPTKIPLKGPSLLIGQNYIDGKWLEAGPGKRFNVTDPASWSKPQSDLASMVRVGHGKPGGSSYIDHLGKRREYFGKYTDAKYRYFMYIYSIRYHG